MITDRSTLNNRIANLPQLINRIRDPSPAKVSLEDVINAELEHRLVVHVSMRHHYVMILFGHSRVTAIDQTSSQHIVPVQKLCRWMMSCKARECTGHRSLKCRVLPQGLVRLEHVLQRGIILQGRQMVVNIAEGETQV